VCLTTTNKEERMKLNIDDIVGVAAVLIGLVAWQGGLLW
jgi:hypothetical protein